MKTRFKAEKHSVLPAEQTIEVWHNGEMIAAIYGADGPGIRIVSKYHMSFEDKSTGPITIYEIKTGGSFSV